MQLATKRYVYPVPAEELPLQVETIGLNPDQEAIVRPLGYPYYHWLQTIEGEGELRCGDAAYRLPERSGILLPPNVEHRYHARGAAWKTYYVTFSGTLAPALVAELLAALPDRIHWDEADEAVTRQVERMIALAESGTDAAGWDGSAELYRLLTLFKTNGRRNHLPSLSSRLERLRELLDWLDKEYANPGLGLAEMAARLGIGERQLNERFRQSFGLTAYAYLIQLRLRKAKQYLPARPDWTVRRIGKEVGFRDASHFVATFRRAEGMTPEQYRRLHGPAAGARDEAGGRRPSPSAYSDA